jgi:alkanesulfonate monooxygenase SsuD/methylene tetrahydromethanopterin reductase-like flavin-dependent oxidoreductase (luciferase family)
VVNLDLLEVLKILGPTTGSLVLVIYWLLSRYSKLVDTTINETRQANEKRIDDAKKRAAEQDDTIRLLANLLTVVSSTIRDTREAADALKQTALILDRATQRRISEERRLTDRGGLSEFRDPVGGSDA